MLKHRVITLDTEGAFVAPAGDAMCHLMFDGDTELGRWLLLEVRAEGREEVLISIHHDLDRGLSALAAAAGWSGRRFRVEVAENLGFIRPGKIPAPEILAGLGYRLVRSVVCYALLEPGRVIDGEEARCQFVTRLVGRGLTVGSVDPVGPPDLTWCADVSIPYEGYIHGDDIAGLVDDCMDGSGLEIADEDGTVAVDFATPHVSDVTPFPLSVAA